MIKRSYPPLNAISTETLARWYLRFNGYFIVDNFIVHAGDDPTKISKNKIGNHTEVDTLAIKHMFSKEVSGPLTIQNDQRLKAKKECLIDFSIVEVKTGNQNKPNAIWSTKNVDVVKYILRFAGFIDSEQKLTAIATELVQKGEFYHNENKYSVRLILISEIPSNKNWSHLTNILISEIIDFLVDVRGDCWIKFEIGGSSIHHQWDSLIKDIFNIANEPLALSEAKKADILKVLTRK